MVYDMTAEIERDEEEGVASSDTMAHIRFKASAQVGDDECFSTRGDFRHYPLVSGPDCAICVELVYPTGSKRKVVGDIIAAWKRESSDLTYQEWVVQTHRQAKFALRYGVGFQSN